MKNYVLCFTAHRTYDTKRVKVCTKILNSRERLIKSWYIWKHHSGIKIVLAEIIKIGWLIAWSFHICQSHRHCYSCLHWNRQLACRAGNGCSWHAQKQRLGPGITSLYPPRNSFLLPPPCPLQTSMSAKFGGCSARRSLCKLSWRLNSASDGVRIHNPACMLQRRHKWDLKHIHDPPGSFLLVESTIRIVLWVLWDLLQSVHRIIAGECVLTFKLQSWAVDNMVNCKLKSCSDYAEMNTLTIQYCSILYRTVMLERTKILFSSIPNTRLIFNPTVIWTILTRVCHKQGRNSWMSSIYL